VKIRGDVTVARIVEAYFHLLKILIAAFLAVMVVLVFGNVFLRYAFNTGITSSEELSRLLFVWLTFLGAIVALREHGHLGVDMLVKRLPTGGKKLCLVLSHLLMLYVTWLFLSGSWQQTLINLAVASPSVGLSMGLFYGVGVIFSISAGLILLFDLFRVLAGRVREEELVMVKESEEQEEFEALQKELAEQEHRELPPAAGPPAKNA
jgi:TRAP-type C4-dicarboxylate transport system permease small subunit